MANSTFIQVRTSDSDKRQAAEILEQLGTNISSVVNMLLKQIILTESIPFEITLKKDKKYDEVQALNEVKATMSFENIELDDKDLELLTNYQKGILSPEDARLQILKEMEIENE